MRPTIQNSQPMTMRATPFMLVVLCSLVPTASVWAQVDTEPRQRNVLLEQFTALNCGNCPAGHAVAANIEGAWPEDVIVVGIHGGSLAVPSSGQPDLRSPQSAALFGAFAVPFTPLGAVNRRPVGGQVGLSTSQWSSAAATVLQLASPVNLRITSAFDAGTRMLDVEVELYYTASSPGSNDRLHVLLSEDHIVGWQSNYGAGGSNAAYDHRHVLRTYLTPLAGVEVPVATQGETFMATWGFTVPMNWDPSELEVVAFVNEPTGSSGLGEIYQVERTAAVATAASIGEDPRAEDLSLHPVPASDLLVVRLEVTDMVRDLQLFDVFGRLLRSVTVVPGADRSVIDVRDLPVGSYFLRSATGDAYRFMIAR